MNNLTNDKKDSIQTVSSYISHPPLPTMDAEDRTLLFRPDPSMLYPRTLAFAPSYSFGVATTILVVGSPLPHS